MQVRDVMTENVQVVRPDASIQEAAALMKRMDVGPMPVCDGERLVGMVTDRDLAIRATAEGRDPTTTQVSDVMTPDVIYCFEDQDIGVVDERLSETHALLVSLGELAAVPSADVGDARPLHHRLDAAATLVRRDALDLGDKRQIFGHGHIRVQRRRFRQVTGSTLGFDRLVEDIEPRDDSLAIRGGHVSRQDAHRGRFPGTVGPQESENLSALGAKAHVLDGGQAAEPLGEVLDLDHVKSLVSK